MSFASNNDIRNAVTMVSYEQSWLDANGTLALRNNTSEGVTNVVFLITYLDMSGNELDYEEYTVEVDIAPGMTKKVDIPAYEHRRDYHYYKSRGNYGGSPAFNIKFQLEDYNVDLDELEEDSLSDTRLGLLDETEYDSDDGSARRFLNSILPILAAILAIGFIIGLYVLIAVMARERHRSAGLWVLLSLVVSPFLIILILLIVGEGRIEKLP